MLAGCGGGGGGSLGGSSISPSTGGSGSPMAAQRVTSAQILSLLAQEQSTNSFDCGADAVAFQVSAGTKSNPFAGQPCWHFLAQMNQTLTAPDSSGAQNASYAYQLPVPSAPTDNCGSFPGTSNWTTPSNLYLWVPSETMSTYCRNPMMAPPVTGADFAGDPPSPSGTGWQCLPESTTRLYVVAVAITNSDPNAAAAIAIQGPATRANCQLTFPPRIDPFGPSDLRNYNFYLAWETLGQPEPNP